MTQFPIGRRAFLQGTTLVLTGNLLGLSPASADGEKKQPGTSGNSAPLKIGLITDLHYANKETRGTRHYRETTQKLDAAAEKLRSENLSFIVELGDFIDSAPDLDQEMQNLKTIQAQFARLFPKRYYVLGNHCVERLTKSEFLTEVGQEKSFFSFDHSGFHFVILDGCFRGDGVPYGRLNSKWDDALLPPEEINWLKSDLAATQLPTIVFIHQRLDVANHYAPHNAKEVREILEGAGNVKAVFQGHSHSNDYKEINGIHYCTLCAMIEGPFPSSNAFSVMSLSQDGTIAITGFAKQKSYDWSVAKKS